VKKSHPHDEPGTFRATFEDKILMSDIVSCRLWVPVAPKELYLPVTSLLAAPELHRAAAAASRGGEDGQGEEEGDEELDDDDDGGSGSWGEGGAGPPAARRRAVLALGGGGGGGGGKEEKEEEEEGGAEGEGEEAADEAAGGGWTGMGTMAELRRAAGKAVPVNRYSLCVAPPARPRVCSPACPKTFPPALASPPRSI